MRIFIAYRHSGADLDAAGRALALIKQRLAKQGHPSYCTLLDGGPELCSSDSMQVLELGMRELRASDALLLYVDSSALSAGMYIEVGIALASRIPVYLLQHAGIDQPYLRGLSAAMHPFTDAASLSEAVDRLMAGM